MAQTRATSKALRQPLGFVMTLAGYSATPAEEMPRDGNGGIEDGEFSGPDGGAYRMEGSGVERLPDTGYESRFQPPEGATEEGARGSITDAQNRMIRRLVAKLDKDFQVPEETLLTQLQLQYEKNEWMALEKGEASTVITDLKKQAGEA
jgi:hypothetical protein